MFDRLLMACITVVKNSNTPIEIALIVLAYIDKFLGPKSSLLIGRVLLEDIRGLLWGSSCLKLWKFRKRRL